jgi:hypothetical protein
VVVAQRCSIKDLHNAVDSDKCTAQRIVAHEGDHQMIRMRYVAYDGECLHRKFLDAVVLIVADDQHSMLATAA